MPSLNRLLFFILNFIDDLINLYEMDWEWKKDFGLRFFYHIIILTTLKIAIVGSRTFTDYTLLVNYIEKIAAENTITS